MSQDLLIKRLEQDMTDLKKEVKDGFEALGNKIDNLDSRFVTRREWEVTKETSKGTSSTWQMVIMLAVAIVGLLINVFKL